MNARLDPFKDVGRLEKELKRNELYEDILKQLTIPVLLGIISLLNMNNNYQELLLPYLVIIVS